MNEQPERNELELEHYNGNLVRGQSSSVPIWCLEQAGDYDRDFSG